MAGSFLGTIQSENVVLKPMQASDICQSYLDTLNDKSYMRFSRQCTVTHTPQSAIEYMLNLRISGGELVACLDKTSGELVATVSVRFDERFSEAHMGLLTLRSYRALGVGTQCWTAVLERVCAIPTMTVVRAGTHHQNLAMQSILRRSGFEQLPPSTEDPSVWLHYMLNAGGGDSLLSPPIRYHARESS